MKRISIYRAYLKSRRSLLFLLAILLIALFAVYGLYGLPWGPAIYVALIILAAVLVFVVLDFLNYQKKFLQLRILKQQAGYHLGELPLPNDLLEQEYQAVLRLLEKRCLDTEENARQSAAEATQYYTLWSHQIKTPIAAIRLLLQEETLDRGTLEQELFKTEQYVEMVLQYQRLGMDSHDLVLQEYSVDALVKQALKKVSTLFIHKKIGVNIAPINCRTITDEKWMIFVIEQLLTNAVKYTQEGKVSIYLADNLPETLVIEDTGIGIQPEDLSRVFEWGYTGYNGRLNMRSTGIGLSLCKQVLTLLGHSIAITSTVGKGTKVMLSLSREKFDIE
ncbi:sensor histidine kinase [Hydrogenoanaerobacterium sp.]|uniref:sensor histidine kinase n=1 Tax=Hydrogenoanaerobacterium sp. TaxID=2953763 RepID=UPI002898B10C|nr:sensor histidine kinase [Hydrogenoanaerobacterium sp.]